MNNKQLRFVLSLCLLFTYGYFNFVQSDHSFQRTIKEEINNLAYSTGEIAELWNFPSDHLPIGASIDDFHLAFWNVLNKNYLGHIEENTQGLLHSSILTDHVIVKEKAPLTLRELKVINDIEEMIYHPTFPRSVIALQETHRDVQNYLTVHLPANWAIVTPNNVEYSQDLFLYDTEVFELVDTTAKLYDPKFPKSIFSLTLKNKNTHKLYKLIQSHIPGGPILSEEGCAKFSAEVMRQFDPSITILLMGDMNQDPQVIEKALESAAQLVLCSSNPYQHLPVDYPTHVNAKRQASWIDTYFIYSPVRDRSIRTSTYPYELFTELIPLVELLHSLRPEKIYQ